MSIIQNDNNIINEPMFNKIFDGKSDYTIHDIKFPTTEQILDSHSFLETMEYFSYTILDKIGKERIISFLRQKKIEKILKTNE